MIIINIAMNSCRTRFPYSLTTTMNLFPLTGQVRDLKMNRISSLEDDNNTAPEGVKLEIEPIHADSDKCEILFKEFFIDLVVVIPKSKVNYM